MAKIVNPDSAGIDVSSKDHYVAIPEGRSKTDVACFSSFTRDLHRLVMWLQEHKIKSVAMESTGVYWYHLFSILLDYGFEVHLVNAYHVKNVPGRKSDARWLQQLHSFGLLKGCFQPDNITRTLRNYVRLRKQVISQMTQQTQRMQKALELMNIKLNLVIRDINGKTGSRIIEEILKGERCAEKLASYREKGIKASTETLTKALEGNWRQEQLFCLKQSKEHYQFLEKQLQECDIECEKVIIQMNDNTVEPKTIHEHKKQKNQPQYQVEQHLYNALGVDVTKIYGLKASNAITIFSETGTNLKQKFPSEKQFLSWLNVVPDNKISGGKVLSSKVKKKKNRAGQAFRDAATALWRAKNPLGDYLRSKKAKSGSRQAVVATARKIAAIYYKMVTDKIEFDPEKLYQNKAVYLQKKVLILNKQLQTVNSLLAQIHGEAQVIC